MASVAQVSMIMDIYRRKDVTPAGEQWFARRDISALNNAQVSDLLARLGKRPSRTGRKSR